MPLSESAFRSWITEAERHERLDDYDLYEKYYLGQFDEIDLPTHVANCLDNSDVAMWANLCKPIIDTVVQYICGGKLGITVSGESEEVNTEAEDKLYQVYKNNGLLLRNMIKAVRVMCKKGDCFISLVNDKTRPMKWYEKAIQKIAFWKDYANDYWNTVKVRILNPAFVFPKYTDNDYEELELVAIKYYELDDEGDRIWRAKVMYSDVIQYWKLADIEEDDDEDVDTETPQEWQLETSEPNRYGFIPIVHIPNTIDDREYGVSDLHDITKIQYMFLKTLTDLMLTMDYQAFQRVYVIGGMTRKGQGWDSSPGVVSEIPNPDAKVEFVPNAEMSPFLDVIKMLKQLGCEVSQTPQIALGAVEGGIPSGYALRIQYMPLENKCNEKKAMLQDAFQSLNWMIFAMAAIDNQTDYSALDTEIQFTGGLPVDRQVLVEVHEKQINNGTISRATAMQEEGIEDAEEEMAKIEAERSDQYADRVTEELTTKAPAVPTETVSEPPTELITEEERATILGTGGQ